MICIDLEDRSPTDTNISDWKPWSEDEWEAWLDEADRLLSELAELQAAGDVASRNKLIDDNRDHWGKLKPWLLALSRGKCWFSEVRELYSHFDVEHFRPKKEAKSPGANPRDGYWWLAFDYMNFRVCGNVGNRKKGGWFPLQKNSRCSTFEHQCEESEEPYLLDPIDDEDVKLLAFDEEGNAVAAPYCSPWEQERVAVTVERLKLNEHVVLAEERRKIWAKTSRLMDRYLKALNRCRNGGNPGARQKVRELSRQVKEMTLPSSELSAVARWCVLLRNDPQLSRLVK